ncbi:hypothetical protein SAMN05216490_1830 [Mucilaginibacter mallensis]|uniref:PH domain-containing protein n=1 Tax=Mucilaginibacter mallensis TaxID=652787 RepID=A0A1H1V4J6_MUCMA|nr:hypothetical protein [Mucilaginibacter mallensis]SDS79633.1 hypothetical protein SAMN05216490_1830 [Mucilaginibacter mallensis]
MARIKLSSNLIVFKSIVIIFILLICVAMIGDPRLSTLLGIFIASGFFYYMFFYLPDKIEFDENNMYLIDKHNELTISLKNIYYVKRPLLGSNGFYKIKYHTADGDCFAIFYPRIFTSSLRSFKAFVIKENPQAITRDFWNIF